jgi:hypothetical protein
MTMASSTQQFLELRDAPTSASGFACRGLFSPNYLLKHFAEQRGFPSADETRRLYEAVRRLWEDNVAGLRRPAGWPTQASDPPSSSS